MGTPTFDLEPKKLIKRLIKTDYINHPYSFILILGSILNVVLSIITTVIKEVDE
ncbi:hypothetical protein [Alkalibacillus haloalkaliphilus]|uniref:Uncharacterized protein n=1 Tax=Alkalibacillus haloalkaliphilus TaxID=94136 RepID=A0A511VZL6_9BACI|nr:hypothetical protein [Alkalibacillus haloalkaliphilus]GEN44287.1 hypothetical protein AHA02nite_00630 [Alkalibacillus haloalkaliphilus]